MRSGTPAVPAGSPLGARSAALGAAWRRAAAASRDGLRDTVAGLVGAVVLIANIVSFGALLFPGELHAGMSTAIWAMLIGGSVGGVWIALRTSIPPIATGIDSPTGTVLVLLSASAGASILAAGGSAATAVSGVMLIFTAATVVSGVLLWGLGACRWGSYFRFVPYPVVGGFLAATGWFLVAGGIRMTTGRTLSLALGSPWTPADLARLAAAVAVLLVLLAVRRFSRSAFAVPSALLLMWLLGAAALRFLGLSGPEHGWHFPSLGELTPWSPWQAARASELTSPLMTRLLPELLAVTIVALISLVTKVSSLEVARQAAGDLDREFRVHGIASLAAAPVGGLISSLQTGTSRLLEQAGGATRMSGVVCALALGAVGLASFDLPGLIPIAIVAGLVFNLGYTFIVDALWKPYAQRAWLDLLLAIAIMVVCVRYGYLVGVLVGVLCACVMFAISYARFGVVRRHMTRAQFAGYVDRTAEASAYLREHGDAIQMYWLAGYIFFGSSESVFERIRGDIEARPDGRVSHVILDFGMAAGADSSAVVSLAKLRNFCEQRGITLVYCSLSPANHRALALGGVLGGKWRHETFPDVNLALAWCEDRLLAEAGLGQNTGLAGFEQWLQQQLGPGVLAADLVAYFDRKDTDGSQVIYREGEPADAVDLVAAGNVAIEISGSEGQSLRLRRLTTHTVVGEMGFFRHSTRAATVSSDGPATLFALTRANFERMRRERPDLASAFDDFILRVLADRIEFANHALRSMHH
jgi:SulP family sulfate permease